eukprot:4440245-Alexandrium_andersonii.AAC.1
MRRSIYVLEQPASSLMPAHPRVRAARVSSVWTWMGCFGHRSQKPTCLFSNEDTVIYRMKRTMTQEIRDACSSEGVTSKGEDFMGLGAPVYGGKDLKVTQEYTREYTDAIAQRYLIWRKEWISE